MKLDRSIYKMATFPGAINIKGTRVIKYPNPYGVTHPLFLFPPQNDVNGFAVLSYAQC